MSADLAFMALAHESNRFELTKSVAKVTRILHRPNTRVQDTMNEANNTPEDIASRTPAPLHDPAFDHIQPSPWPS
jgi:hypothetical protein